MGARAFEHIVRVYYEDTDFSGVVYHARYLHFLERARTEALRVLGVSHSNLLARTPPLVFAVRRMQVDWIAPARIDDVLTVRTRFLDFRGARMMLDQGLWRGDAELVRAGVEAVCLSIDGRPRRLPSDVVDGIEAGIR